MHPASPKTAQNQEPGFIYPTIPLAPQVMHHLPEFGIQAQLHTQTQHHGVQQPIPQQPIQEVRRQSTVPIQRDPVLWSAFRCIVLIAVLVAAAIEASVKAPLPIMAAYACTSLLLLIGVTLVDRQRFLSMVGAREFETDSADEYVAIAETIAHHHAPQQPQLAPVPQWHLDSRTGTWTQTMPAQQPMPVFNSQAVAMQPHQIQQYVQPPATGSGPQMAVW